METVTRLEIFNSGRDTRAEVRLQQLRSLPSGKKIIGVALCDVYTIEKPFQRLVLKKIAAVLSNPLIQTVTIHQKLEKQKPIFSDFDWAIEIGFLPGVTDNVAHTAREIISDLLRTEFTNGENIYTSQITFIRGKLKALEIKKIAASLHNPLIQRIHIKNKKQFMRAGGMDFVIPKVTLDRETDVTWVNLNIDDKKLAEVGKQGIRNKDGSSRGPLALSLPYMKAIQNHFRALGRNPTDVELESLAQTWSEHCKHTIFADPIDNLKDGLFKTYIKSATEEIRKRKGSSDMCISVFTDNSGAIAFSDDYLITHKVETHNSPSALDPYGGAITGIVGVNRDTLGFGLGAKPIANFYGFCLADPKKDTVLYTDKDKTQKMLSSRRIMDGVIEGVNAGGNQSGIPTPAGFLHFDERYRGKPLVFVGTVGLLPRKIRGKLAHKKQAKPGDYIVMIGGRVGKDGIHGATFSSESLHGGSPATAVQIGDPITQKKLSDALIREARGQLLYNSITDNGAGGLSCSVAEMAKESGGCRVQLEKVPLKYPGLVPWEIWVSESQERMTLAIPKRKWTKFEKIMARHGIEATVIGEFTRSGRCVVSYKGKTVLDLDMQFLHNGLPKQTLTTVFSLPNAKETLFTPEKNLTKSLLDMIGRLNIASYEFISEQYDHVVLGNSMLGPLQGKGRINGDVSVIRPVISEKKAVSLSQGLYPEYSDIDTYHMAAASLDTAVRNTIAAGANPDKIAILDNFCWCSSNEQKRLGQLKRAAKACYDYAVVYGTPFISGKDSMFNDFEGFNTRGNQVNISIPPTLLITSIGIIDDITHVVSLDSKMPGDLIYILGETFDELGASEYFSLIGEKLRKSIISSNVPKVDGVRNKKLYDAYYRCSKEGLVACAQSVGRGGLAVALAKIAMGGLLGVKATLKNLPGKVSRDDFALFSESQGRIVATVAPKNRNLFETYMAGNAFACIGQVTAKTDFRIAGKENQAIIDTSVDYLLAAYRKTFRGF